MVTAAPTVALWMVLQTLNKPPPPVLHMVYLNIASRNTKMLHNYRRLLYSEPQEAKSDAFSSPVVAKLFSFPVPGCD